MIEREYAVLDGTTGIRFATGMTLDMALVFIRGYVDTFYNEDADLRIVCSMVNYEAMKDGAE